MKKLIILLIAMIFIININALKVGEKEFSIEELRKFKQQQVKTEYQKRGELRKNTWEGVSVKLLLEEADLWKPNTELVFQSADNYLVRLSSENLPEDKAIIALVKDGVNLDNEHIRLIVKDMRDMFWIRGVAHIYRTEPNKINYPEYVYNGVNFISVYNFNNVPGKFKNAEGYKLSDFLNKAFPATEGEFTIYGKDGVNHTLDFEQFLENAKVLKDENSFSLKSVDMPGGMWVKNLICVFKDNRAVFFTDDFKEVNTVLKNVFSDKKINYKFYMSTENKENSIEKGKETKLWKSALLFRHLQ